jgi:hypothetical protein
MERPNHGRCHFTRNGETVCPRTTRELALHLGPGLPRRLDARPEPSRGSIQRTGWPFPGTPPTATSHSERRRKTRRTSGYVLRGTSMSPSPCGPRWSASSQQTDLVPRMLGLGADALGPNARVQDRDQPRKAELTGCSPSRPQRRHKRLRASSEASDDPPKLSPASNTLGRSVWLGVFGPSPARLRERPTARVRNRTLTSRFQPSANHRANAARPRDHREAATSGPAPKHRDGWAGVAARAPRSPHQTREHAASSATTPPALATAVERPPPFRRRSAEPDGRASGSGSEEPSPAPRNPRTRECSCRTTQPARLAPPVSPPAEIPSPS